jgi:hypothetical protein
VYEVVLDLKETSRPVTSATLICGGHASGELWAASPVLPLVSGAEAAPSGAQGNAGDMPSNVGASSGVQEDQIHALRQLFVTFGDDGVLRLWDAVAHTTLVCFVVRGKDDAPLGGRAVAAQAVVSSMVRDNGQDARQISEEDVANVQKDGGVPGPALNGLVEIVACLADGSLGVFRVNGSEGTACVTCSFIFA